MDEELFLIAYDEWRRELVAEAPAFDPSPDLTGHRLVEIYRRVLAAAEVETRAAAERMMEWLPQALAHSAATHNTVLRKLKDKSNGKEAD